MFESFIEDYERREKFETAKTYRKLLKQFENWLNSRNGKGDSTKFGKETVLEFLKQKEWANSSKNVFLSALSSWASSELEKVQPPTNDEEKRKARRLKRIKNIGNYANDSEETEALDLDDVIDVRMALNSEDKKIFWILSWFGLRVGELKTVQEIDYENQSLTVETLKRSNHTRTLYFDKYTSNVLERAEDKDLLSKSYQSIYRAFSNAGDRLKIELHPHVCRHTFATKFGERTDPFTLAKMLGHSLEGAGASRTTGKYVHPSEEKIREIMTENHYLKPLELGGE